MVCMWGGGRGRGEGGGGGWTDRQGTNDTQTCKTKDTPLIYTMDFSFSHEIQDVWKLYLHEESTGLLSVISLMGIIFQKEVIEE